MKKSIFILTVLFHSIVMANNGQYHQAMMKNLQQMDEATTIEEFQAVANSFDRIGNAEKSKWLPYYYSSFVYVLMGAMEKEPAQKDGYFDLAKDRLDLASGMEHDQSEVKAMEGFIYMMKLTVDPATRGQEYSPLSMQALRTAQSINPRNPRAVYLLGQMTYGSAQFFGSDTTEACDLLNQSLELFESQDNEDELMPKWGKRQAMHASQNCNK